jgi:hypothetical protein
MDAALSDPAAGAPAAALPDAAELVIIYADDLPIAPHRFIDGRVPLSIARWHQLNSLPRRCSARSRVGVQG